MRRARTLTSRINFKYPVRSLANYASVRACYAANTDYVVGYPSKILFEPTSFCNLKCPLCPTGVGKLGREDGHMTLEQFKTIVDEIKPYTTHMELAGYGEPFLNENICDMIRYASDAGIFVNMHSNANLIDTEEKVRGLVSSGLGHLSLSVDGATQETYQKYRVGGSLETVVANAAAIMRERKRQGRDLPVVTLQVVVTRVNEDEVEEIRKIAEKVGVDHFHAKRANLTVGRPPRDSKVPAGLISHWMPKAERYNRFHKKRDKRMENGCDWLYKRASIYWNGDVTTCCHDATNANKMGNVFEAGSFWKVWNGKKYQELRRQVNVDITQATPLCSVCPNRTVIEGV